ncbi:family UPF0160 protein [Gregarina niphandrodes]|uniref:Family UPF0160 protein n=1 Tax=Gregarina niphandrodes TaxID=110365 RepID=A0A023B9H0_GRENI|nr:family UPF0160 protein [Gregarina niphandrodes]EZG72972.1 family UPF0160 protein [Gregarina niphandrodes]|eukprot:XP_011129667.1 family UPF0160 protein [Gregarina niphandrodes]
MTEVIISAGPWTTGKMLKAGLSTLLTPDVEVRQEFQEEQNEPALGILALFDKHIEEILEKVCGVADPKCREFTAKMYREKYLDGIVRSISGEPRCDCTARLFVGETGFSSLVGHMDPLWSGGCSEAERHVKLQAAVAWVREVFKDQLTCIAKEIYPAHHIVQEALDAKKEEEDFIVLSHYCPWQKHLYALEAERGLQIKWILFQDDRNGQYRLTAVADETDRFNNRALIHQDLRGLRGQDVANFIDPDQSKPECQKDVNQYFAHHSGFTGGAPSLEAARLLMQYQPANAAEIDSPVHD